MPRFLQCLFALGCLSLLAAFQAPAVAGHAAFVRSDPAAGATLPTAPPSIRIWFSEPLEPDYTRAVLLDATGNDVQGVTSEVDANDAHLLVLTLPPRLADGGYTVSWRNLSAADGHSLQGYFGFRVGEGGPAASAVASSTSGSDALRAISRWLALLGLAALIAIGPAMLLVVDPASQLAPELPPSIQHWLRGYGALAMLLALLGSVLALAAQAVSIAPDAPLTDAMVGTLRDTRYGQLWIVRLGLLIVCALAIGVAIWGRAERRQLALVVATLAGVVAPLPFSLLSHAAALDKGQAAAVTADALHLLSAALWSGGLLVLVFVFVPAVLRLSPQTREGVLLTAIPRFSVLGLASWGVLLLTGLYASWLQVGTIEALRETDYGRTLLVKGLVLVPALALAAYHYRLGWRGPRGGSGGRTARTLTIESMLAVVVLLVVGRLIGLEPAREVIASRTPTALTVPLSFDTNEGTRQGTLAISPGAAGPNTFTLYLDGDPLPEGSEGVLRFSLPGEQIGEEELRLPAAGPNQFRADGSELALAGQWRIDVIARKIGSFSWSTHAEIAVAASPAAAPQANPAPVFGAWGVVGMVAIALGLCALAAGTALRDRPLRWRLSGVIAGIVVCFAGAFVLAGSRLAPVTVGQMAMPVEQETPAGTPPNGAAPAEEHVHAPATPQATPPASDRAAAAGTPVSRGGLTATLELAPTAPGPAEIEVMLADDAGKPVTDARVVLVSEMTGMGKDETPASETAPGRYVAADVPLSMSGEWRLLVRVSPKGAGTQIFAFSVDVP